MSTRKKRYFLNVEEDHIMLGFYSIRGLKLFAKCYGYKIKPYPNCPYIYFIQED